MALKVGFLINPLAGLGGTVGLKGSDGAAIAAEALRRGAIPRAAERAAAMFDVLGDTARAFQWFCGGGGMGADLLRSLAIPHTVVREVPEATGAVHTREVVQALRDQGVGLMVFAGGDGTARDIAEVIGTTLPVIGIPAGVKMHSGVFATSPRGAAALLTSVSDGELVNRVLAEVRDVDEAAAREGRAASRYYGEMCTPAPGGFVQHTKIGGREDDALAVEEIVQGVCALVEEHRDRPWVLGPGGTLLSIKERLGGRPGEHGGGNGTLLGVDVRLPDGRWLTDVGEADLLRLDAVPLLIVGFGRNQGILFGRGNQQLSAAFLRRLDRHDDIVVVSTRSKLRAMDGRPLLLDTGDAALDVALSGVWEILCGYDERLLYRVEAG